jgi:hypothetical protein
LAFTLGVFRHHLVSNELEENFELRGIPSHDLIVELYYRNREIENMTIEFDPIHDFDDDLAIVSMNAFELSELQIDSMLRRGFSDGSLQDVLRPSESKPAMMYVKLSCLGVPILYDSNQFRNNFPENVYEVAYFKERVVNPRVLPSMIVVGETNSVDDLCLAWNLRAAHLENMLLDYGPRWATPKALHYVLSDVNQSLTQLEDQLNAVPIRVASSSLSSSDLKQIVDDIQRKVLIYEEDDIVALLKPHMRRGKQNRSIVNFVRGVGVLEFPSPTDALHLSEDDGFVCWDVSLPDYRSSSMLREVITVFESRASRPTIEGIAGDLTIGNFDDRERWAQLRTADTQLLAREAASRSGFAMTLSDKGRLGIAVLELMGDTRDLNVLCSSVIYHLLRDMCEVVSRQAVQQAVRRRLGDHATAQRLEALTHQVEFDVMRESQFDRQHWSAASIEDRWKLRKSDSNELLRWLIERRIVLRGFEASCPNCGLRRWYPVDRVAERHTCDGCLVESPLPVRHDQLPWRYRINELVARAVDQGVIPHLQALRRMIDRPQELVPRGERIGLLGGLPGVLLIPKDKDDGRQIEVDLFALLGDEIVIGECKATGADLSPGDRDRLIDLGRSLKCATVIFATPTSFDELGPTLHDGREVDASSADPRVLVWERRELLDVVPLRDSEWVGVSDYLPVRDEGDAGARAEEDRSLQYLNHVVRGLQQVSIAGSPRRFS